MGHFSHQATLEILLEWPCELFSNTNIWGTKTKQLTALESKEQIITGSLQQGNDPN